MIGPKLAVDSSIGPYIIPTRIEHGESNPDRSIRLPDRSFVRVFVRGVLSLYIIPRHAPRR